MLSLKECTCGETTFKILVDTKIRVACAVCGTLFSDPAKLPEVELKNVNFQLRHA